ncbi:MAG: hypothetical protein N2505_00355 [Endomicrobia bacterium]|nr:hypothetical protein [Endomicrobiia bacterium]
MLEEVLKTKNANVDDVINDSLDFVINCYKKHNYRIGNFDEGNEYSKLSRRIDNIKDDPVFLLRGLAIQSALRYKHPLPPETNQLINKLASQIYIKAKDIKESLSKQERFQVLQFNEKFDVLKNLVKKFELNNLANLEELEYQGYIDLMPPLIESMTMQIKIKSVELRHRVNEIMKNGISASIAEIEKEIENWTKYLIVLEDLINNVEESIEKSKLSIIEKIKEDIKENKESNIDDSIISVIAFSYEMFFNIINMCHKTSKSALYLISSTITLLIELRGMMQNA